MSETLDRLETALAGPDEVPASDFEREAFTITDHDMAAWASRKLRKAHAEIEIISEWEAREVRRVRDAAESERNRWQGSVNFLEGKLGEYLVQLRKEGRKSKSLVLPGGRVQMRARQPSLTYDEAQALAWLKENGHADLVKTKEFVKLADLKAAIERTEEGRLVLKETGEVIDWLSIAEQADSISFSPAESDAEGGE